MNRVPIADVFYIIEFDKKVFPLVRIGVVFTPGREEDGRFADTVAKNRSLKLKSFVDYEKAVAWLNAKQTLSDLPRLFASPRLLHIPALRTFDLHLPELPFMKSRR